MTEAIHPGHTRKLNPPPVVVTSESRKHKHIRLVTVPYTGTRFLTRVLLANGYEQHQIEHQHTHAQSVWPQWFAEGPVLCTIRNPVMHLISCANRKKGYNRAPDFATLARVANEQTHFFRTDWPDRDEEKARLEEWLGHPVNIEWTPVGSRDDITGLRKRYLETGEFPPEFQRDLHQAAPELFRRLGYDVNWLGDGRAR